MYGQIGWYAKRNGNLTSLDHTDSKHGSKLVNRNFLGIFTYFKFCLFFCLFIINLLFCLKLNLKIQLTGNIWIKLKFIGIIMTKFLNCFHL